MPKDYYDILGVEKNASAEQIKQSYRERAKLAHPDLNKSENAEIEFQSLNEAYMVLSDPEERLKYDQDRIPSTYTHDQVIEILRQKDRDNELSSIFRYTSRNVYPEPNYSENLSAVKYVNLVILSIALLFVIDLSLKRSVQSTQVFEVNELFDYTRNVSDIGKKLIITTNMSFQVPPQSPPIFKDDEIKFQRSLIFGKLSNVIIGSTNNAFHLKVQRPFTIGMTIIVMLIAMIGLSPLLSAERKFNAAIIGGFLCLPLFISLVLI